MKNRLLSAVIAVCSAMPLIGAGCAAEVVAYRDPYGHPYAHRNWRGEEVYQREDGRWYARRSNNWIVVEGDIR
jgi:hypothetical protein